MYNLNFKNMTAHMTDSKRTKRFWLLRVISVLSLTMNSNGIIILQ